MIIMILPLVFQSCEEDEKEDEDVISLPGTEWVYALTIEGLKSEIRLKFLDNDHFQLDYYRNGEEHSSPIKGTYALSGSEITLRHEDGNTNKGSISGNKIIFDDLDMGIMRVVFTKRQ
ncbi:MAG: lipocalin family protein [Dysgonamonadaceae bacterium]|nr:lipocalin family protein [Dysgonamonadaceae bacterium]